MHSRASALYCSVDQAYLQHKTAWDALTALGPLVATRQHGYTQPLPLNSSVAA